MSNKTDRQPDPYKIDRLAKIPPSVKAVFIKWWFAGAVYYFVGMGIQALDTANQFDLILVLGIVLGMVNDLLVNNIFRYMRTDKAIYDPYMMFPQKKFYTFFCNILYYTLISAAVAYLYNAINLAAQAAGLVGEDKVWLTAEPVLYGVFILLLDMALLGIKALIKRALTNKASKKDTD